MTKVSLVQLSVFIPATASLIISLIVMKFVIDFYSIDMHSTAKDYKALTIVIVPSMLTFAVTMCLFIEIWKRVLVFIGALTKEEAKGYPSSKYWEKSEE